MCTCNTCTHRVYTHTHIHIHTNTHGTDIHAYRHVYAYKDTALTQHKTHEPHTGSTQTYGNMLFKINLYINQYMYRLVVLAVSLRK